MDDANGEEGEIYDDDFLESQPRRKGGTLFAKGPSIFPRGLLLVMRDKRYDTEKALSCPAVDDYGTGLQRIYRCV